MSTLFAYAEGEKKRMYLSVVLSVLSMAAGLAPFYCMYAMLCLFVAGTATAAGIIKWCLLALPAYAVKILLFSLSTGVSHAMAYTILEALTCGWPTASSTRRSAMWRTTPSARSRA